MEQGYITTLSKLGLKSNNSHLVDYLRNKVVALCAVKNARFDMQEVYDFTSSIGFDVVSLQPHLGVQQIQRGNAIYNINYFHYNAIIKVLNSIKDIYELTVAVCYFANSIEANSFRAELNGIIVDAVKDCDIDVFVVEKRGRLHVHRRGAEVLDNPLIFELLAWLPKYEPALKSFETALEQYSNKQYERNCVDNLRHAFEMLVRAKLNSNSSLENLKSDIGKFLKENGVPKHIANMFTTLQQYYTDYQNNYVKHDDKVDQREIEFILYLTGTMMRFIISADRTTSEGQ